MPLQTMSRNNSRKSLGELMKNLETREKTGRVGRYDLIFETLSHIPRKFPMTFYGNHTFSETIKSPQK